MTNFEARDVQSALEEYTWTETGKNYKKDTPRTGPLYLPYALDENGNLIVESTYEYEVEFSWEDAEDGPRGKVWTDVEGIGNVEFVASEPGQEGGGESIWLVIRTERTGQLFRIDGYYMSYDGSTYDGDLYEVSAQERTVIVYE